MPFLARITLSEIRAFDYRQILVCDRDDDRRAIDVFILRGAQRVKRFIRPALVAAAFAALTPSFSSAAEPPAATAPPPPMAAPTAAPSPRRALPDYDGRPPEATTAGEALLWVPRVILFPVHEVYELAVRWPLGALTVAAESGKWAEVLKDVFTFGPNNNIGVVPTALLDFGFRTSVGVYAFYDDFLVKDNALRLHAGFGGTDWLRLTIADRIPLGKSAYLKIRGEASRRPDFFFFGIGPTSRREDRSRYGADWLDGSATFHAVLPTRLTADVYMGVKTASFYDRHCCGHHSVHGSAALDALPVPTAFDDGYTGFRSGVKLAFDTRRPRPEPGSGVRLEGNIGYGADLRAPQVSSWVKYGGAIGGFVDVTGHNHVLSLAATALFVDPLKDEPIPFVELVPLGGVNPMGGFRDGCLLGRSAAVATFEYRYPIWAFLDGSAQFAVGNVFNEHLAGLEPKNLRFSFDFGVRMAGERDNSFSILVGAGSETFGQGAHLNEARLLLGATSGF